MTDFTPIELEDTADFQQAKAAQAEAAHPEQSSWVEANAGSGKTKVLIDRVARLLLRRPDGRPGARPDSILCITYTKAAANEMLSRLFERLGGWAVASDDTLRSKLAELEGRTPADYDAAALRDARALFARALETPGGLRIETIHAFCARVLRRFPLEAGVSPGFVEIEDADADALWYSVLEARIEAAAAAHPAELITISRAAGGFGASAALDALRSCRQQLAAFAEMLSADAEADLRARIQTALGAPDLGADELLARAMDQDFPDSDLEAAIALLQTAINPAPDKDKKNKTLLAKLTGLAAITDPRARYNAYLDAIAGSSHNWPDRSNPYSGKPIANTIVEDLFSRDIRKGVPEGREITRMKAVQEALRATQSAERTTALLTLGLPILAEYRAAKAKRAALDFDDLISYTRRLLTMQAMTPWVLYKLDGGLTHILLDEAQDTSPPQWDLINALAEEFRSGLGRHDQETPRTQFVVGDPKQSIYSFQGADQQYFDRERLSFISRETQTGGQASLPEMTMSFRSSPEILTFVDEVAAIAPLRSAVTDVLPPRDADIQPHVPRRLGQPGRVELWPLCMPEASESAENAWIAPVDHTPKDAPRRRLADKVAVEIRAMLDRGETVWRPDGATSWRRTAMNAGDVLILVRSRGELFDALIDSLKSHNLPVAGADRLKLLENIGVQHCLNLVRFALQPADDLTLAEILRGPFCGLTDDDNHLFPLAYGRPRGQSLYQCLMAGDGPVFAPAKAFVAGLLENRHLSAFEFLGRVLSQSIAAELTGLDQLVQCLGEPVREPVQVLVQRALGHQMARPASLQAFLAEIEADQSEIKRDMGEADGAVRVMTVHGAKGLQAPVVILPDTTKETRKSSTQIFFDADGVPLYSPSSGHDPDAIRTAREQMDMAGERESRRLLYVAMTRAQDRLIICGAGRSSPKIGYAPSSWYRWCLTAMLSLQQAGTSLDEETPEVPETVLTLGDPVPVGTPMVNKALKDAPNKPDWLTAPAPQLGSAPRLYAPSTLLADKSAVVAPLNAERVFGLRRGRLIHALLQVLPEQPESDREAYADRFLQRVPDLDTTQRAEIRSVTIRTLNDPAFEEIFAPGGRSEAAIVGTLPNGQAINGRVDRLLVSDARILLIDYKTDRPAPETPNDIDASYIVQMAAYRAVLEQIYTDGRPVSCGLLYTDGPKLINLDLDLLSESLNRLKSEV